MSFEKLYPQLTSWVESRGWIEIGDDGNSSSWLRILDEGGLVWESEDDKSLNEALNKAVCDDSANGCKSPSLFNGSSIDYDVEWYFEQKVVNLVTKTSYNDHGVGVASIIGAPAYNNKGTSGLASFNNLNNQNVTIVPVKIKGNINSILKAIHFIIDHKNQNNVKVINISQGIPLEDYPGHNIQDSQGNELNFPIDSDPSIRTAIKEAYDIGILTVITAGNSNYHLIQIL